MAAPLLIGAIKAFNAYNKFKIVKDCIDLLTKKKVDKVDKIISYIPGLPGRIAREIKFIRDKKIEFLRRIDANARAIRHLNETAQGRYNNYYYWNLNRFTKNLLKAQSAKENIIKDELKHIIITRLKSLIPLKGFYTSIKGLAQAITDNKGWYSISKKVGQLVARLGFNGFQKAFKEIDRINMLWVTSDGFWRSISTNRSSTHPIINSSGANKILKILQYKDKLTDKLWDRSFWFNAKSEETGNFNQNEHEYNCVLKTYTIPIRGWHGKMIKKYTWPDIDLTSILYICIMKPDFGHHYWKNFATEIAKYWARFYSR